MARISIAKLLGGLALIGPLTLPAWAGDNGRAAVQIYSTEDVVKTAVKQDKPAEQAVPKSTEGKPADAANGNGTAKEEESVGTLQEWLNCKGWGEWLKCNRIKVSGHTEVGVTLNDESPNDRQNFGRLFDDRSNDIRLNQTLLTMERALDPKQCCDDWGFKLQVMYGSDSRFVHSIGFMDNVTNDSVQPDIVEAYLSYHTPGLTDGGVDFKIGQFVTLMGAEVIYAPANPLYSHSYIFNFGIPFKHTGVMATAHVNSQLDVMAGIVAGINTGSFDDNNSAAAFHGGFTWKNCCETTFINGSIHIGPENDGFFNDRVAANIDSADDFRYIESLQIIHKLSDCLTYTADINVGADEGFDADWYGIAQYLKYDINKCVAGIVRVEVFRDNDSFAVFKDTSNDGFVDLERGVDGPGGFANFGSLTSGGNTTYTALTLGLNVKPYENLLFRPEIRWDWSSGGAHPFGDGNDSNQFTAGVDMIWFF